MRKRAKNGGLGGLFPFKISAPFVKPEPRKPTPSGALIKAVPTEITPIGTDLTDRPVMNPSAGPYLMYEAYQSGPGYSDHRMFGFQKTADGWKSYGAWKAEGRGEIPLPVRMTVQSPSAMNSIINRCLGLGGQSLAVITELFDGPLVQRSNGPAEFLLDFMDNVLGGNEL